MKGPSAPCPVCKLASEGSGVSTKLPWFLEFLDSMNLTHLCWPRLKQEPTVIKGFLLCPTPLNTFLLTSPAPSTLTHYGHAYRKGDIMPVPWSAIAIGRMPRFRVSWLTDHAATHSCLTVYKSAKSYLISSLFRSFIVAVSKSHKSGDHCTRHYTNI